MRYHYRGFRRRWAFGKRRSVFSRRGVRLRIDAMFAVLTDSPLFYLLLCGLAVYGLTRAYSHAVSEAAPSSEYVQFDETQTDWQQVWREMNGAVVYDSTSQTEPSGETDAVPSGTDETDSTQEDPDAVHTALIPAGIEIIPRMQLCIESLGFTMEQLCDFDYLFNRFYTLNSGTSITADLLDARTLLSKDLSVQGDSSQPQILIYHTHSQEAYRDSVPGEVNDTIVGVGNYLTQILTEQYGYNVIHHTGVYDMTDGALDRDQAYQKACPEIEALLAQYPSIEIVIDLHRDGVREDVHLITDINGTSAAKIMFFNGVCRDENGDLADLTNPYREDNLAFSLQMRLASMLIADDFCRTNYLKTWRYNQQFLGRCILVEVGAQTNTVEEAMNAMPPLAQTLDYVLGGSS